MQCNISLLYAFFHLPATAADADEVDEDAAAVGVAGLPRTHTHAHTLRMHSHHITCLTHTRFELEVYGDIRMLGTRSCLGLEARITIHIPKPHGVIAGAGHEARVGQGGAGSAERCKQNDGKMVQRIND